MELGGGGFNSVTRFGIAGDAGAGKDAVFPEGLGEGFAGAGGEAGRRVAEVGDSGGVGGDFLVFTGVADLSASSRCLRRNSCFSFSAAACSFTASCRLKSSNGIAPSLGSGAVRSFIFGAVSRLVPPTSDSGGDTPPS